MLNWVIKMLQLQLYGKLAQMVERPIRIQKVSESIPEFSIYVWMFLTQECLIIKLSHQFVTAASIWWTSSNGRASDSHSEGIGIDARVLHLYLKVL